MKNEVLENAILENCKVVDKVKVVSLEEILADAKAPKRGRKAFDEMDEDELYVTYVKKCEAQKRQYMSRDMWNSLNEYYSFEELLSTEDIESQDSRYFKEPKSAVLGYIGDELDYEVIDKLYKVLFKALNKRLIILLNLESVPGLINTAYSIRFNECDCKDINLALNAKLNEIKALLEDDEVQQMLKSGITDMSLYNSEDCLHDYIETYQKVLRQLTSVKDEALEYIRDIFHNEFDIFEDEIIANDKAFECEAYYEDANLDEDEEDSYLD